MYKCEMAMCNDMNFRQSIRTRRHNYDAISQASQMLDQGSKQVTNSGNANVETAFR